MRRRCQLSPWFVIVATLAGCAAPRPLPRVPQVPPLAAASPVAVIEPGMRAAADRSPPSPRPPAPAFPAVQEPVYRTVTRVIEVPAAAPEPPAPEVRYEYVGYPYVVDRGHYHHRPRDSWFPVNTVVGAGIGAVIGNQHSRRWRDRGALIGAGYGLLFDLPRWLR
ncbi:MAG: glycine zipper 2TM domain-containing protein [Planctomycetes bacterium]|nr:glycine zipper 2TM domain-containing protein [Planctomycetota bacterium]